MLKKVSAVILITAIVLCLSSCGSDADKRVLCNFGVDMSGCELFREVKIKSDILLGNGGTILIYDCSANKDAVLEQIKDWDALPLTEELSRSFNGIKEEYTVRKPKRGYYLKDMMAPGFLLAMYDTERNEFTYIELKDDTLAWDHMDASVVRSDTGVDVSQCVMTDNIETHGGFLGDGDTLIIFDCSGKNDEITKQIVDNNWKPFPLPGDLDSISFPDPYGDLPGNITNGYYFFINRHSEAKSKDDTTFSKYSRNYTIAVYDTDAEVLYYCRCDS